MPFWEWTCGRARGFRDAEPDGFGRPLHLLSPIKIALRPRPITLHQVEDLTAYGAAIWSDCLVLEKMWQNRELDAMVKIEDEELEIARIQPWGGSSAIIASDGLLGFGAAPTS